MSCGATREHLHREAASLDEAQRLRLDDHLAACAACRADRERLRLVREVGTSLPVPPPGAREYSRAIARALIEGAPHRDPAPARRMWLLPIVAGAFAAAALLVILRRDEARLTERVVHVPQARPAPLVPPPPLDDVVADGVIAGPTNVKLPAMRIALADATRIRWTSSTRTILVEQGKISIEASGEPARVITERFEVELADADASIDKTGVRVRRGTARVVDRARKRLAELEAGSDWQPTTTPPKPTTTPPRTKPVDLAMARAQLAAGQHAGAERTAETVLARSLSRAEEAEARMFLADLAQATGNLRVAVSRYETVATKFPDLPTAESALYAAARIEARSGHADAAHTLFDRYLDRYPNGRYADDVRKLRRTK